MTGAVLPVFPEEAALAAAAEAHGEQDEADQGQDSSRDSARHRRMIADCGACPNLWISDRATISALRKTAMSLRPVKRIVQSQPTIEGAGVKLRRAFGFGDTGETDPFLLLDDFRNDRPADYLAGFPCHPHRGIETITYVVSGTVAHGDSL